MIYRLFFADSYLWHVVRFTFWQSIFIRAYFSILPAIWLAKALYRRQFVGRTLFLRLCAMSLVLPVLVALFGILTVYGRMGWLAQICQWLGIDYHFTPYGFTRHFTRTYFFSICHWLPECCYKPWKVFLPSNAN